MAVQIVYWFRRLKKLIRKRKIEIAIITALLTSLILVLLKEFQLKDFILAAGLSLLLGGTMKMVAKAKEKAEAEGRTVPRWVITFSGAFLLFLILIVFAFFDEMGIFDFEDFTNPLVGGIITLLVVVFLDIY